MRRSRPAGVAVLAALGAAAAVIAVIAGIPATSRDADTAAQPIGPSPTPTEKHNAVGPVPGNGRITSAERFLRGEPQDMSWRSFDPVSETALGFFRAPDSGEVQGLVVLGRTGPVATLTCGRGLPCSSYLATLGPGPDEVTVASGNRAAQVIGHDGALRRTIDLSPRFAGRTLQGLRWSPDGSHLAVLTTDWLRKNNEWGEASRVWLVDRRGGSAELVYSLLNAADPGSFDSSKFDGRGRIWFPSGGWSWSPDGQSLLLDVLGRNQNDAVVVVLRLQPEGAADPVIPQTLFRSYRGFDWYGNVAWSPDGTRIAMRTGGRDRHPLRITEISAEDGSVIAHHPHNSGWLIWPAREGQPCVGRRGQPGRWEPPSRPFPRPISTSLRFCSSSPTRG